MAGIYYVGFARRIAAKGLDIREGGYDGYSGS